MIPAFVLRVFSSLGLKREITVSGTRRNEEEYVCKLFHCVISLLVIYVYFALSNYWRYLQKGGTLLGGLSTLQLVRR